MPAHVRAQLRAAVVAALSEADVVTGPIGGVRLHPWSLDLLPAIEVSTPSEATATDDLMGLTARTIDLQVMVTGARTSLLEDDLDAIAAAVETALATDAGVQALAKSWQPASTAFDPGDGAEVQVARLAIGFRAVVHSAAGAPTVAL